MSSWFYSRSAVAPTDENHRSYIVLQDIILQPPDFLLPNLSNTFVLGGLGYELRCGSLVRE